jgi:hypothetical protein
MAEGRHQPLIFNPPLNRTINPTHPVIGYGYSSTAPQPSDRRQRPGVAGHAGAEEAVGRVGVEQGEGEDDRFAGVVAGDDGPGGHEDLFACWASVDGEGEDEPAVRPVFVAPVQPAGAGGRPAGEAGQDAGAGAGAGEGDGGGRVRRAAQAGECAAGAHRRRGGHIRHPHIGSFLRQHSANIRQPTTPPGQRDAAEAARSGNLRMLP